jgi:hypothetical protein
MRFSGRMKNQHPRRASSCLSIVALGVCATSNQAEVRPGMNMERQMAVFRIADVGEKQIVQTEFVKRLPQETSTLELFALCPHLGITLESL